MKKIIIFFCLSFITLGTTQAQGVNRLTGPKAKNQKYFGVRKTDALIGRKVGKGIATPASKRMVRYQRSLEVSFKARIQERKPLKRRRAFVKGPKAKNFKPWKD